MITVHKKQNQYEIMEDNVTIFHVKKEVEDHLDSYYTYNIYGDEVLGIYQVKRWFSKVNSNLSMDYTMYENDEKLAELRKQSKGFQLEYFDSMYSIYGKKGNEGIIVKCKLDHLLIAKIIYHEQYCEIHSRFSNMNAIISSLACLCFEPYIQSHLIK